MTGRTVVLAMLLLVAASTVCAANKESFSVNIRAEIYGFDRFYEYAISDTAVIVVEKNVADNKELARHARNLSDTQASALAKALYKSFNQCRAGKKVNPMVKDGTKHTVVFVMKGKKKTIVNYETKDDGVAGLFRALNEFIPDKYRLRSRETR